MEDFWNKYRQNEMLYQRVIRARRKGYLKYKLVDIDISQGHTFDDRMRIIDEAVPRTSERLHYLLREHYRAFNPLRWSVFLREWIPVCTNFVIIYTCPQMMPQLYEGISNEYQIPFVCALGMYIRKFQYIYGRMLCSRCYVGMKVVEYLKEKYKHSSYGYMTMHTTDKLIPLYMKHGACVTDQVYLDSYGRRYPFLYVPFSKQLPLGVGQDDEMSYGFLQNHDIWYVVFALCIVLCFRLLFVKFIFH